MVQLRFQKGINSQKVNIEIIQEIARSLFFTRKKKRVFQIIFWYAHPVFYSVPPRIKYIQDWPSVIFFKSCVPCGPDNPDGVHLYVIFPGRAGDWGRGGCINRSKKQNKEVLSNEMDQTLKRRVGFLRKIRPSTIEREPLKAWQRHLLFKCQWCGRFK